METVPMLLGREELQLLAALVGGVWDHHGAQASGQDGAYALVDLFVRTSTSALTFTAQLVVQDFEGSDEEYSRLRITPGATGEDSARRSGNLYFWCRGMRVIDVLVIRDTTRQTDDGEPSFELVSDTGVVVVGDTACLGVFKGSAFIPDLFVRTAVRVGDLQQVDTFREWEPDLHLQYTHRRELLRVRELLAGDLPGLG